MNTTEERLVSALKAEGDTLGPEDVPELRLPRRKRFPRPLILAGVAASVAIVVGAGATLGGSEPDPKAGTLSRQASWNTKVTIFLCTPTSPNPACGGKDATQAQKDAIAADLKNSPSVSEFAYENKRQAYERFKELFEEQGRLPDTLKEGDIADAFFVTVRDKQDREPVAQSMLGRPGVDQVVME